ncbi:unnamed protein product [Pleuronectes platessa]|uniref:Uncharacterized protein n=1 Tax=Pleuronectes platessa TaxID=8262 RepID=A0A9N7V9R2_PLEPL|nr:unnamed protein product [Pleuronectes platessa]
MLEEITGGNGEQVYWWVGESQEGNCRASWARLGLNDRCCHRKGTGCFSLDVSGKSHKKRKQTSAFMPLPTLVAELQHCSSLIIPPFSSFASRTGRLPAVNPRVSSRLTRRGGEAAPGVTSPNEASCQTSRGCPGPRLRKEKNGADRTAICKDKRSCEGSSVSRRSLPVRMHDGQQCTGT